MAQRTTPVTRTKMPSAKTPADWHVTTVRLDDDEYRRLRKYISLHEARTGERLTGAVDRLDSLWLDVRNAGQSSATNVVKAREAAAMLATSRWMYRSALARTESRGMHKREDYPAMDSEQRHYLVSAGLDDVEVSVREAAQHPLQEIAA